MKIRPLLPSSKPASVRKPSWGEAVNPLLRAPFLVASLCSQERLGGAEETHGAGQIDAEMEFPLEEVDGPLLVLGASFVPTCLLGTPTSSMAWCPG